MRCDATLNCIALCKEGGSRVVEVWVFPGALYRYRIEHADTNQPTSKHLLVIQ